VQEQYKGGDGGEMISEKECLENKWEGLGLGFGTGRNVVEGFQDVEHREVVTRSSCIGGGCETWRTGLLIGCQVSFAVSQLKNASTPHIGTIYNNDRVNPIH
jgi:hypothetical protein